MRLEFPSRYPPARLAMEKVLCRCSYGPRFLSKNLETASRKTSSRYCPTMTEQNAKRCTPQKITCTAWALLSNSSREQVSSMHVPRIIADSDVIVHGYIKKLGGPFTSAWQTRYGKLYPSRLELYPESLSGKPEVSSAPHPVGLPSSSKPFPFQLVFMDQIEDVCADLQTVKGENAIVVKLRDGFKEPRISLTNSVSAPCTFSGLSF